MMEAYANSHYSQEQAEEYLAANFSDGEQCALWNGTHTQRASWLPDKMTDVCRLSRSGMMFKPLTDELGEDVLMSFLEGFHARIFHVQEKAQESPANDPLCGNTWRESSVKFDRNTRSWKTHQCLWEEDLKPSSLTLPKWGMMRGGVLWERITPAHLTSETESGSLHQFFTPTARDYKGMSGAGLRKRHGKKHNLADCLGGVPNPTFSEWLMGWPLGWTDLKPLETDRFQQWLHLHGKF
jgi:hypothetical protein